ncbi:MAG: PTS system mannose/fructose/sorbose family transporter subunit IID [Elusimicrobia bacterium]|nr:PTS system mannose/fructose/sorbose family transporter subunit IID [Elusimicrobiota bacterium]MDE2236297.1 PTS system mannose/fructose/sorbose family transporter subunit IID [Elusimicrobiota bacterium]MDE2424408.1 PTS system mannose/fructose/sorbose family transporter subunit IID [Elusimicrobiota bacterium]
MSRMTPWMRTRLFTRSLFLQATWSFERMQGLGFAFAIEPWIDGLYPSHEERNAALKRHSEYFNTQPYAAPLILGVVCALEESAAAAAPEQRAAIYERIGTVKKALAASLAGLGDALFWSALRPACVAAALACWSWMTWRGMDPRNAGLIMAGVYAAGYNLPVIWLRWRGIDLGYAWGEAIPARLQALGVRDWVWRVRIVGTILTLVLLAAAFVSVSSAADRLAAALCLCAAWACYVLAPARTTALRLYAAACAFGFLALTTGRLGG